MKDHINYIQTTFSYIQWAISSVCMRVPCIGCTVYPFSMHHQGIAEHGDLTRGIVTVLVVLPTQSLARPH